MIKRTSSGATLLIGALLDRLGSTQAQALLQRLDRWVSQEDRDDLPPRTASRRRRAETGIHHFEENIASKTQKDQSS
jgi:hypothetical protein